MRGSCSVVGSNGVLNYQCLRLICTAYTFRRKYPQDRNTKQGGVCFIFISAENLRRKAFSADSWLKFKADSARTFENYVDL